MELRKQVVIAVMSFGIGLIFGLLLKWGDVQREQEKCNIIVEECVDSLKECNKSFESCYNLNNVLMEIYVR